jgi:chromosome segregation ATPase
LSDTNAKLSRQMTAADTSPLDAPTSPASDDAVHVDQAAKALGVSRRTVERMVDRGQLRRDTRHDSRVAMVTKRSLVEVLEAQRRDNATRQSQQVSQPSAELAGALEAIDRLADTLADERRQLMAAAEDRRRAERDREEARIEAARVQAELAAYREAASERAQELAADRDALRAQLEELAGAGPIRALRLRRRLRTRPDG